MQEDGVAIPTTATADPPLVSVIMAAFNAAGSIEETCRSVLGQTYPHLELIVVDDGSSDETASIVATLEAADRRVRLITQPNRGVATARNAAIAQASGQFIAPIDADDLWLPTKVERQVRIFQQHPNSAMVYCWWAWIDEEGRVIDRSPRWTVEGRVFTRLAEVNFTGNASVPMFRRGAVAEAGGYDAGLQAEGAQGCEDWSLALQVAANHPVSVVPAALVGYRRQAGGMSRNCERMWRSYQTMCASIGPWEMLPPDVVRRSRAQFALYLAGVAFWARDYVAACRWGFRSRSPGLAMSVFPHALAACGRRMAGSAAPRRLFTGQPAVDEDQLPEPLIPYDRIYSRYWRRREDG